MDKKFWLTGALILVCALMLSAAVYNGITIGTGETFDASVAGLSKPYPQLSSTPGSCTGSGWMENTTDHSLNHCVSSVWTAVSGSGASDGAWTNMTLTNGWTSHSGSQQAQYMKDSHGRVFLRGLIDSGTTTDGTTIFTLPSGFRPPGNDNNFLPWTNGYGSAPPAIQVQASGTINVYFLGGSATLCLCGTNFSTL